MYESTSFNRSIASRVTRWIPIVPRVRTVSLGAHFRYVTHGLGHTYLGRRRSNSVNTPGREGGEILFFQYYITHSREPTATRRTQRRVITLRDGALETSQRGRTHKLLLRTTERRVVFVLRTG